MVSLSLIELQTLPTPEETNPSYAADYRSFTDQRHIHSFVRAVGSSAHINDVTTELNKGLYNFKTKYTILFLYDFLNDDDSFSFIKTYGGNLHTRSSAGITVLTYFTPDMADSWPNVLYREGIGKAPVDTDKTLRIIRDLQKAYGVKTMPTMVVIHTDEEGNEESFNLDLSSCPKDGTITIFRNVIDILTDYCDEDFSVLAQKICGSDSLSKKNTMDSINTFNYVHDLIKKKAKATGVQYTQFDLAAEMRISVRNLRNKRNNNTFERDECFYLALRFEISVQDLNELLRLNNQNELGMSGRDGIIMRCLFNRTDVYETNNQLVSLGYKGILRQDRE